MPAAVFQCAGTRSRFVGRVVRLPKRTFWFFARPTSLGRLLFGTALVGTLTRRKNGTDVLELAGTAARFVGRLSVR